MARIDLSQHIDFEQYYLQHVENPRRRGDQLDGLCPLHDDTNESFTVNVKTGLCLCRAGCGSGDIIWFHGEVYGHDRKHAFKDLCIRYNIGRQHSAVGHDSPGVNRAVA